MRARLRLAAGLGADRSARRRPPTTSARCASRWRSSSPTWCRRTASTARELHALFAKVQPSQSVARAIAAPSTAKPWYEFKPLFVDREAHLGAASSSGTTMPRRWHARAQRVRRAGRHHRRADRHRDALRQVHRRLHRWPRRCPRSRSTWPIAPDFFRGELEQFLLAGARAALGPARASTGPSPARWACRSSCRAATASYAIDFDGDGQIDLWRQPARRHRQRGELPARVRLEGRRAGRRARARRYRRSGDRCSTWVCAHR